MPIVYKLDVLEALKGVGYNTGKIRKERIMGEATLQKIRKGELVSHRNLEVICRLLNCQPGDIMGYIPDKEKEQEP